MVTRIEALNYRCLKHIAVDVPQFAILIGPNASGKSTLFDVLLFIKDMLNEGLEQAVLKWGRSVEDLTWLGKQSSLTLSLVLELPESLRSDDINERWSHIRYEIEIGTDSSSKGLNIQSENFAFQSTEDPPRWKGVFAQGNGTLIDIMGVGSSGSGRVTGVPPAFQLPLGAGFPFLAHVARFGRPHRYIGWTAKFLSEDVHLVVLSTTVLRRPSPALYAATSFRPDGSNIPHLIETLKKG